MGSRAKLESTPAGSKTPNMPVPQDQPPLILVSDRPQRFGALRRTALGGRMVHQWLRDGETPAPGARALHGDPTDPGTFAPLKGRGAVVVVDFMEGERAFQAAQAASTALPLAPVLLIDRERGGREQIDGVTRIDEGELLAQAIGIVVKRAAARRRLGALRRVLQGNARCVFLVQHDPDPDAIASALTLRCALDRNSADAPIVTLGGITRPENRRLVEALEIDVRQVTASQLGELGPLILVDVQPPYFSDLPGDVAAVIDHHPITDEYAAGFRDVRTDYGASATIAAEYLLAAGEEKLTRELATALLYGILTDTRNLVRAAGDADIEMFSFLFPRADVPLLRAIEHPSYSPAALRRFGRALQSAQVRDGVAYIFLGRLDPAEEHIVAQLADFCLGFENARVAVVAGVFGRKLVMSTRALSPAAQLGDRLRQAFGDYGSAGGHPVMAKAVIRMDEWKRHRRITSAAGVEPSIRRALMSALREAGDR